MFRSGHLKRFTFLLAAFLFAAIALFPLRLAADLFGFDRAGLRARAATGSLWTGVLHEAHFGPAVLGDVEARLNLLPLLIGRARLGLKSTGPQGAFEAALVRTNGGLAIEDSNGRFALSGLPATLPLSFFETRNLDISFSRGRCAEASGRVTAGLAAQAALIGLPTSLSGTAACRNGRLVLPLVSASGMERLEITLSAGGAYRLLLLVRPADPAWGGRLQAAGFRVTPSGYALRIDGRM